jgi:hypothetical protein
MDGDKRELLTLRAQVGSRCASGATLRAWLRLGGWPKRKRKRKGHGYEYDVSIFHDLIFLSLFWPSLTSRH